MPSKVSLWKQVIDKAPKVCHKGTWKLKAMRRDAAVWSHRTRHRRGNPSELNLHQIIQLQQKNRKSRLRKRSQKRMVQCYSGSTYKDITDIYLTNWCVCRYQDHAIYTVYIATIFCVRIQGKVANCRCRGQGGMKTSRMHIAKHMWRLIERTTLSYLHTDCKEALHANLAWERWIFIKHSWNQGTTYFFMSIVVLD